MRREPLRGEIYEADLGPTAGSEQRGRRPLLVISIDEMNRAPAELLIAVPLTTTHWANDLHVRIEPGKSGLARVSYAMPEMVRHLSTRRLGPRLGRASLETVDTASRHVGVLIGLGRSR